MSAAVAATEEVPEASGDALGRPRPYLWGLSLARLLGRSARWATVQAGTAAALVSRRTTVPPSPELVQRLSELMKDASEERQRELAADPEFWLVIEELHRHRPAPARRVAKAERVDAGGDAKQAKKGKAKPKAKAETPEEAGGDAGGEDAAEPEGDA